MDKDEAPVHSPDPGPSGVMPPVPVPAPPPSAPVPATIVATGVKAELLGMGFTDEGLIDAVIAKNGSEDLETCVRDIAAATEWDPLLDDLEEMGFANRELNQSLMLKNGGNIKRTVKDLVEA